MRFSVTVLAVFVAFFSCVCAQDQDASELSRKRYQHLRNWVQKAKNTAERIQTWKYRTQCLKDDESMLPQRLLDWFHVLKSEEEKKNGKQGTKFDATGCTSPAITWFFGAFDKNEDLVLDQTELAEVETIPYEHCMTRFFDKCDSNNDNKLDLQETCSCFSVVEPPCNQELRKYKAKGPMVLGAFKPACDEDGYYKPRQCHEQYCWCVDRFNQVIEGTKDKAWLVKNCRDNTDPGDVLFAGDDEEAKENNI